MNKFTRSSGCALPVALALASGLATASSSLAQVKDSIWEVLPAAPPAAMAEEAWVRPAMFKPALLDIAALSALLKAAPAEDASYRPPANPLIISLPMPDGSMARFKVWESPIMEAPLAAEFPEIKTYAGAGLDDPAASIRFDLTPQGFHSQLLSPNGAVYIDPFSRNNTTLYAVYYKRDYTKKNDGWDCGVTGTYVHRANGNSDSPSGATFRTYRLANSCTGEYAAFHGGTVALAQAAIVTAINRVTGVYELDQSIRLILVGNNSSIVYTNSSTDPFTNGNPSSLLSQNQNTCDTVIGSANYDIGHVFSTAGGGLAALGVVGANGSKAQGETGTSSPIGDPFTIDYVAHEMGHQFGANHCFNSTTSSCSGNRSSSHAYEPGSASTIMGYAGICGADDLQPHSDPYMHHDSHDAITSYTSSGVGAGNTQTATGNSLPTVSAVGGNRTIPANTPFTLTAQGSDANAGDVLTYCWEEHDLGVATTIAAPDNGTSPIIRSWNATTSPSRTIPRLSNLLANTLAPGEKLPSTNRTLNFRVIVRDNRVNGGGYGDGTMAVTVVNTGSAFAVTSPNTAVSWTGTQTVTWNVAGTTAAPISCANVAILLSTDGGNTFPITLLSSTPNTGSAPVTLPAINTTTARIKVAPAGNIFFDISNTNFTITAPPSCYPNCDASTTVPILNANDFQCFLNAFAAGDTYANCDASTVVPTLNANDFQCFLNAFAAGCT